jgi:hypothetical protein
MRNNLFKPFKPKSKCCKAGVEFYQTTDVGYMVCKRCRKQCEHTQPKTKHEKFDMFIKRELDILDYYEKNKRKSNENFKLIKMLNRVRDEWKKIYFS